MKVTLRPEQERVVGEAIRAGLIGSVDDVIEVGVETIRQRLGSSAVQTRQEDIEGAVDRLGKFGEKYRFSLNGIAIKDPVNEGRR